MKHQQNIGQPTRAISSKIENGLNDGAMLEYDSCRDETMWGIHEVPKKIRAVGIHKIHPNQNNTGDHLLTILYHNGGSDKKWSKYLFPGLYP